VLLRVLRQVVAIAVLPFTVLVLIPLYLARRNAVAPGVGVGLSQVLVQLGGLILLAVGGALFAASLRCFAGEGRGTLAPWDPPIRLVVRGPYRYVRNPMISGVAFLLFGEAALLLSVPHLRWAVIFVLVNALYIPLFEEPGLARKFGGEYRAYRRHVPRLLPRLRPWVPGAGAPDREAVET